jgi:hypothetical protein
MRTSGAIDPLACEFRGRRSRRRPRQELKVGPRRPILGSSVGPTVLEFDREHHLARLKARSTIAPSEDSRSVDSHSWTLALSSSRSMDSSVVLDARRDRIEHMRIK